MGKPVQRKRYKIKQNVTCEQCINCMYIEHGDMYCDEKENMPLVYDEFYPTEEYMWCQGKRFIKSRCKHKYICVYESTRNRKISRNKLCNWR